MTGRKDRNVRRSTNVCFYFVFEISSDIFLNLNLFLRKRFVKNHLRINAAYYFSHLELSTYGA